MARTVNEVENAAKRNEILDTVLRFVFSKGYERTTIQDIRGDLGMSNGAFFHYFDSKPAILEALIDRIRQESDKPLLPIVNDPHLPALKKLQNVLIALDQLRIAEKKTVVTLFQIWYTDENALVRQKVDEAVLRQRAPLLSQIVHQGIAEGVFTNAYPDQAGEVIMSLLQRMGTTHAGYLLAFLKDHDEQHTIEHIMTVHAAYMDSIERVLGAPPNSLDRNDAKAIKIWLSALRDVT